MGVDVKTEGAWAELRLNWPDQRNAFGVDEARALAAALAQVQDATAIVLSAEGNAFCAGGNLREITAYAEAGADAVERVVYGEFQALARALAAHPAVLIAAVDGPAIGFGADLALGCDVTFVGAGGWFAQGWVRAGLIPATGGALHVMKRGGAHAHWRFLVADRIGAQEAQALGLACAEDEALPPARALARALAALPAEQVRATKALMRCQTLDEYLPAALTYQRDFLTRPAFAAKARALLGET